MLKTKTPENVYNQNVDNFVDDNVDKRKLQKTSTIAEPITPQIVSE